MLKRIKKGVKRVVKEVKNLIPNETNEYIKRDMYDQLANRWGAEKIVEVILLGVAGACVSALCGGIFIPNKGV